MLKDDGEKDGGEIDRFRKATVEAMIGSNAGGLRN